MSSMKSLQYTVRTVTPVIMSQTGSDQNLVASLDHIRGRAILGSLASRYIQENGFTIALGQAHKDPVFRRLFLSNSVHFADLIPAREDATAHSYTVFAPAPLSLQSEKHSTKLFNLLQKDTTVPTKPVHGYVALSGQTARVLSIPKQIQFHNARATTSESRPLARRQGHTTEGGIFNYEAIAPGELFWGEIWGSQGDLETLKSLMEADPQLTLGRSRTAQYGAVDISTIGIEDVDHATLVRRYSRVPDTALGPNEAVLVFVSPSILVGRLGRSAVSADAVRETISQLLGGDKTQPVAIHASHAFLREDAAESFVGTWQMKTPRMPALAAGSIVRLQADAPWTDGQRAMLRGLESTGIGTRTSEGYGQVLVLMDDDVTPGISALDGYTAKPTTPDRPAVPPPATLTHIAQSIWKSRMAARVEQAAVEDAGLWAGRVSPSLLGKLKGIILHRASMDEVRACLVEDGPTTSASGRSDTTGVLRPTATSQLRHCYKDGHSLYEALLGKSTETPDIDVLASVYGSTEVANLLDLLGKCGVPDTGDKDWWLRAYWAQLLKALRKRNKQEDN